MMVVKMRSCCFVMSCPFLIVSSALLISRSTWALPSIIKIGAIFNEEYKNSSVETAFKYAIHRINGDKTILPQSKLEYVIKYVARDDSFHATKEVCELVEGGVQAIFGPTDHVLGLRLHIHSICDALDIPHLETRPDLDLILDSSSYGDNERREGGELFGHFHTADGGLVGDRLQHMEAAAATHANALKASGDISFSSPFHSSAALDDENIAARNQMQSQQPVMPSPRRRFAINLHPAQHLINEALLDVVQYLNWTRVAIVFEGDDALIKFKDFMRLLPHVDIYLRQVDPRTYSQVLADIKNREIYNLIVDTDVRHLAQLVRGILQIQMNEYKYHYLFTTLDLETFDLEDFKYNFANVTAFRLIDNDDMSVRATLKDMRQFYLRENFKSSFLRHKGRMIEAESAIMYDAVFVYSIGLQTLDQSHRVELSNMSCRGELAWQEGLSLINYMNSVEWRGLTGRIELKEGRRVQFKLDLMRLKQHAIVKVGEWTPESHLNITDRSVFFDASPMNVTLVAITIREVPYVMMHYSKNLTGNDRFYGFCVDILERISREVGFEYILDLVPDGKYGAKDPHTGEWNGMVAQLMKHKADLAVGSMTINYARESVIDFTKPFMNLGISILFKVPTSPPARLFSFMNPLAVEIWIYVLAAYVLVSVTIYVVARFSPYEWHNPHPCETENNIFENQFSLSNSFWFAVGTLMQQGSDLNPRATSTRIVGGIWWFFTLIIISSYTANLAAFLTVERMITPIENAEDLASQTEISYGTLESGSTMTFFRDSMVETYKKMWRFMENKKPSVFTSTYGDGITRVLEGNYAFLMESTMLDYVVQRNCNLTQIGGLLDTKGYGIATPKGSPWRDKISLAILELQEKGEIAMLYDKWWSGRAANSGGGINSQKHENCAPRDKAKTSKANALNVDNIGGVFVVLLCGIAFSVLVAIVEFYYNSKKMEDADAVNFDPFFYFNKSPSSPGRQSLCAEMTQELCYALQCYGPRQRPTLKRQCLKCTQTAALLSQEQMVIERDFGAAARDLDTDGKIITRRTAAAAASSRGGADGSEKRARKRASILSMERCINSGSGGSGCQHPHQLLNASTTSSLSDIVQEVSNAI